MVLLFYPSISIWNVRFYRHFLPLRHHWCAICIQVFEIFKTVHDIFLSIYICCAISLSLSFSLCCSLHVVCFYIRYIHTYIYFLLLFIYHETVLIEIDIMNDLTIPRVYVCMLYVCVYRRGHHISAALIGNVHVGDKIYRRKYRKCYWEQTARVYIERAVAVIVICLFWLLMHWCDSDRVMIVLRHCGAILSYEIAFTFSTHPRHIGRLWDSVFQMIWPRARAN